MIDGVGSDDASGPQQNQVWLLPTGPARVWCGDTDPASSEDWIDIELVDPDGYYIADVVDCASASGATIDYVNNAKGPHGDPIAVARRQIKGLRDGDLVERAGYVGGPGTKVRVVRDGHVVAVGSYSSDHAGGWLIDMTTVCGGSGLTWGP